MDTSLATNERDQLLRRALQGNGLFSGVSGLVLLAGARPVATFLGLEQPAVLAVTGIILLGYAVDLFYMAGREPLNRTFARLAIILDVLWVAGSAAILLAGWPELTTGGRWAVALVAEAVALFAAAQYVGLRRLNDAG